MKIADILKLTKIVFLLQAVIGMIFGLSFLFAADTMFTIYEWPYYAPIFSRLTGMDFIGISILSILSSRSNEWEKVQNVVIVNIIWASLNGVVLIILHFVFLLPIMNWSNVFFYLLFAVLYCYVFIKQRK
jgi:hypothetical protein